MDELLTTIDWTSVPAILATIAAIAVRAWKSKELAALREEVIAKDNELFDERRRHNQTKRSLELARDELDEYERNEDEATESEQGEDS